MKFLSALLLTAPFAAMAVDTEMPINAGNMDAIDRVMTSTGNGVPNMVRKAYAQLTCRSSDRFGLCKANDACNTDSIIPGADLLRSCTDGGHVCCHAEEVTTEALVEAERDGAEVESNDDDYVPEWRNSVADLLKRNAPGAGGEESCWGSQVPYPCGQAYSGGTPRGNRHCINIGNKRVTTDLACKYKALVEAAEAAGHTVQLNSGFRTNAEQTALYRKNCGGGTRRCSPATARPGRSNHQNGIAVDISVARYPRLYQWLRDNATRYGFIRTVGSERWHWEYRPGKRCNSVVGYSCKSPPLLAEPCDGADIPGSETAGLVCRERNHCTKGVISGACRGATYCCKPEPCRDDPTRTCVMPGEDIYGHDSGQCSGALVCAKKQPKCENHPEIGCVPKSEATYGYYSGECPGSLYCPKPPTKCASDNSRICQAKGKCNMYGFDAGQCGEAGAGFECCISTPPLCEGESAGGRTCEAPASKNCILFENDAGRCPGSSTCCRTSAKCSGEHSAHNCVDPQLPVPAGMKHQRGKCPGGSVCLIPA